jgi:histidine triad (HIT) family protein
MSHDTSCVFCDIVAGRLPSVRIYEDDQVLAFMDIYPAAEGHALVVPRDHCRDIYAISAPAMNGVAEVSRRLARAIRATLEPDGLTVTQANGKAAGQTVFHYHLHLIPRSAGARMRLHGDQAVDAGYLRELAGRYAEHMNEA